MKLVSKVVAAVALAATVSTPVYAWGDREQGILAGAAGLWAIQQLSRAGQQPMYPAYPPSPVYQPPMVPYYPGTVYPGYSYRPMYKAVDVFDSGCNCYRTVMVQIN